MIPLVDFKLKKATDSGSDPDSCLRANRVCRFLWVGVVPGKPTPVNIPRFLTTARLSRVERRDDDLTGQRSNFTIPSYQRSTLWLTIRHWRMRS